MDIQELLKNNGLKISKHSGATYEWQDTAVRMWLGLKINGKPTKNWFKLFRDAFKKNKQGILNATYSSILDVQMYNPEYYFYKVFRTKNI